MGAEIQVREDIVPMQADDASVSGLVRLAIERGVDVGVLERLVALHERVAERNARAAFFEAVAAFQDECPSIAKSKTARIKSKRTGAEFSYSYAPLEEIARTIRPLLKKHGLSYSWTVGSYDGGLDVTAVLRHVEGHEERASFPVPVEDGERMSAAQSNGAALTYGKRQSLLSVLGLTTADEDNDAAPRRPVVNTITREQAADLSDLIDATGADRAKVLEFAGVQALLDIPVGAHKRIVAMLKDREKKGAKK